MHAAFTPEFDSSMASSLGLVRERDAQGIAGRCMQCSAQLDGKHVPASGRLHLVAHAGRCTTP